MIDCPFLQEPSSFLQVSLRLVICFQLKEKVLACWKRLSSPSTSKCVRCSEGLGKDRQIPLLQCQAFPLPLFESDICRELWGPIPIDSIELQGMLDAHTSYKHYKEYRVDALVDKFDVEASSVPSSGNLREGWPSLLSAVWNAAL